MTVAAAATETVYALIGVTLGPFNTVWPYASPGDVTVQLDVGDGPVLLAQGADYTLTASNPTLTNGGSVLLASHVLPGSWPAGASVALVRITPRSQPSTFGEATGFSPQASEQALDNVARQVQELTGQVGRAVKSAFGAPGQFAPEGARELWTSDASGELVGFPYGTPNKLIGTDAAGNLMLANPPPPDIDTPGGGGGGGGTVVTGGGVVVGSYDAIRQGAFAPANPGDPIVITLADPWKGGVFTPITSGLLTDDGGTRLVDSAGTTWKRQFTGPVNAAWFYNGPGYLGDGQATAIAAGDQAANPQWIGLPSALGGGVYPVGATWAYVALQEAIYACFASGSTPGHVVWNANAFAKNLPFATPAGVMVTKHSLYMMATGVDMTFGPKRGSAIWWEGPANQSAVIFDAISYGQISNLSVIDQGPGLTGGVPLVDMNWTGANPGLKTQQLTFYDWLVFGSGNADSIGIYISRFGGAAQGDTITFVNAIIVYCHQGLVAGGANALSIVFLGGNVQVALKDGFTAYGGSFFLYGPSFEGAMVDFHTYPVGHQIALDGADAHTYPGGGASARCAIYDVRSENNVLANDLNSSARLQNCGVSQFAYGWGAGAHQHIGMLIATGGLINNWLMCVDDGTPGWFAADAASTNTRIVKAGASPGWAVNQWVGPNYARWFRYGSGYSLAGTLTASDANSITDAAGFYTAEPFPGFTPGMLAGYLVKIAGCSGAVQPAWDTFPAGQSTSPNATGWGFTTNAGSNVVSSASPIANGNYVVVCDAVRVQAPPASTSICPGALIGKVQNLNNGASFTASLAAGGALTVTAMASGTIKIGAALSGGVWGGTVITGQTSGAAGAAGTYTTSNPAQPPVASRPMNTAAAFELVNSVGEPQLASRAIYDGMGFFGAGIPDGLVTWLPIDFDVIAGAASIDNVAPGAYGKFRGLGIANLSASMAQALSRIRPATAAQLNFGFRNGGAIVAPLIGATIVANPLNINTSQVATQAMIQLNNGLAAFTLNMPLWLDNTEQELLLAITNGVGGAVLTWGANVKAAAPTVNLGAGGKLTIVKLVWIGSPAGAGVWCVANVQGPM